MAAHEEVSSPRVVLANINPGRLLTEFTIGVIQSLSAGKLVSVILAFSGPYLDAGRNKLIHGALESEVDWTHLLMVDSDIEFLPEHIDHLTAPLTHHDFSGDDYPILAGVYVNTFPDDDVPGEEDDGRGNHMGPVVHEWVPVKESEMPGVEPGAYRYRRLSRSALATLPPVDASWNPPSSDGASPSPWCQVDGIGAGFVLLSRAFLLEMQATYSPPLQWFDEPIIDGVHLGEDYGFCRRVADMGYPVLVNRACTVLHHKTTKML